MKLLYVFIMFMYPISGFVHAADLVNDLKKRSDATSNSITKSVSSEYKKNQSRINIQLEISQLRSDMGQADKTPRERSEIQKKIDVLQDKLKKN